VTPNWSLSFLGDALNHSVLPGLTLAITALSGWVFGMRNNMINTLGEDYVTFAEANGLRSRTVALLYAARNALLPNVTAFGLMLGAVVGGSVLVEGVYSYPGVGNLLYLAVINHDYPLMQALLLVFTLSMLVAIFVVDLLYPRLDPRVRSAT
jgi:peptide/nickel transport system permease protein